MGPPASHGSRYKPEFSEKERLGEGAFSAVFRCVHRLDGRSYAVKRTRRAARGGAAQRECLLEAQAMAAAGDHPHLVRYYAAWVEAETVYLQMELCPGGSLESSLASAAPRPAADVARMLAQVGSALAHLHSRGIAHMDVKPGNIFVDADGAFKLGDLGLATPLGGGGGYREGDARYLPREALGGEAAALDKVDSFGLGMAAYQMAGGPIPVGGKPYHELREGKLMLLPGLPLKLGQIIREMLHPEPGMRPSAAAIVARLSAAAGAA